MNQHKRCSWCVWDELYEKYHDEERGVLVTDDKTLFEFLILEWAQAWLSWITILRKREWYRKLFYDFDPILCSQMTDAYLESVLENPSIIRNRRKVFSVKKNAAAFLKIVDEFGSFYTYLSQFFPVIPLIHRYHSLWEYPTVIDESTALSKDLKKRGMTFVWPTILYAYVQAVWIVDDHVVWCWKA